MIHIATLGAFSASILSNLCIKRPVLETGVQFNNRTRITQAKEMWIFLGYVFWCSCKANSPFGEFLTYLIFSLIPSKAIVSCEFERVAAAMLMLLHIQALAQLLFQRAGQKQKLKLESH